MWTFEGYLLNVFNVISLKFRQCVKMCVVWVAQRCLAQGVKYLHRPTRSLLALLLTKYLSKTFFWVFVWQFLRVISQNLRCICDTKFVWNVNCHFSLAWNIFSFRRTTSTHHPCLRGLINQIALQVMCPFFRTTKHNHNSLINMINWYVYDDRVSFLLFLYTRVRFCCWS